VPARYRFHEDAKSEFFALPAKVREEFLYALHGLLFQPFRPGPGYTVKELRDHPGLWRLRLDSFPRARAYYEVDGDMLTVYGFGPRPHFYERLRQTHRLSH
jgi:mRNA-degrading endonuclease RelE of RelBE toxin-antitoxin system